MKGEILKLLKETDGYISGQELCEKFGVSRTAVWKVINQLKEEGYEIEAVRNKGYILKGSADVLSKEELESTIHTKWAGTQVAFFEETDSTNNEIRRLAEQGAPHGTWLSRNASSAERAEEVVSGHLRRALGSG